MESERIFYFDALRTIAILSVVLLHVTGHLGEMMHYNALSIFSFNGLFELFMNNFTRIGVDLFFVLSGALLLGREWNIKGFLQKRIPRITKPFLFWSLIFTLMLVAASYFIPSIHFITHFTIYDILNLFVDTLLGRAPGSAVYWFFWAMFGAYLIMPVFNRWVSNAGLVEVEYFLIFWIVETIFEYTLMMPCPVKLTYFISPIGLVLLGYYLRHTERKVFNSPLIAIFLIVIPALLMFVYSFMMVNQVVMFEFHRYSILPIIECVGVFCLFKTSKYLNNPSNTTVKLVSSISICSYGMYLIHSQIIMFVRKILHISFNFTLDYLILFTAGFIISWFIIYLLSKIPYLDEFVGVK